MPHTITRIRADQTFELEEQIFEDVAQAYDYCLDILRNESDIMAVKLSRGLVLLHSLERERVAHLIAATGLTTRTSNLEV